MEGDELYAWQVQEPDGRWSMVGAMVGNLHTPLIHRKLEVVQTMMRKMATDHARETNQPLRLARFALEEVLES